MTDQIDLTTAFEFTDIGLTTAPSVIPEWKPKWEDFEKAGSALATMERTSALWVGDLLNLCQAFFGEQYAQLVPEGSEETWRKYQWVCSKVPPTWRREELTFTHYQIVAGLEDDNIKDLLDKAVANKWTTRELREAVKVKLLPAGTIPPTGEEEKVKRRPKCSVCGGKVEDVVHFTCHPKVKEYVKMIHDLKEKVAKRDRREKKKAAKVPTEGGADAT